MATPIDNAEGPALFERWLQELAARLPHASTEDWSTVLHALAQQPERAREIQERYYRLHREIWSHLLAGDPTHSIASESGDRRFDHPDWDALPWFRYLKQTYLINARWMSELLELAELPHARKQRIRFVLKQYLDALAPTNFAATNPAAIRLAAQTNGVSVRRGVERLRQDLARGRIEMSDERAFEVGRTLAITPGAVVYQNAVVQLIQYNPIVPQVYQRPLFIVPPFINKYYVLDLRPDNSFVRYALSQGLQVFIVSWRNVRRELGTLTWEDYIEQGVLAPLAVIAKITQADRINTLGFCVGGTLLACALAVARERVRVSSLTLLATMLDFADVGDIGVYIDQDFVRQCEQTYRDGGVMPGSALASAFASLRANDLVWFFVVNNYLKGKAPPAFDLLYWNGDSSNLPGRLYAWYLRHAYLENGLRQPGKLALCGQPLDLRRVDLPAMIVATREDHIVPWRGAYASGRLLTGRIEFVLGASGHIAGIVNPPDAGRREYWLNESVPDNAEDWLAGARRVPGSWWPHWMQWLKRWSGKLTTGPRALGDAQYPPLEPAPGSYVREPAQG
jgi:poly[(R)-3-hydroxyalkanoate] polymerase subunit PhaC